MTLLPRIEEASGGSRSLRMPDRERAILLALYDCYHGGEAWCLNFNGIASRTDVPRRYVRGTTRALAARGLAVHRTGLFNEDGGVAGSGYACTELGARFAEILRAHQINDSKEQGQ